MEPAKSMPTVTQPRASFEMKATANIPDRLNKGENAEGCSAHDVTEIHQKHGKASRLRGGGCGKDCFLCCVGCFLCFECCEVCCGCIADIVCCPCELCC
ncbi:hypothetical protein HYPSUDRAFT_40010 [Hypholoma sublateritium FD-334 SS-4]|uniref:Uncharacterized protein n=1 Tax=Hypholoma sublateritium (strain FD-334 SS-4) TaxID=945553 RepID=A0A0D2NWT9_HYPSF|nr:hypothetical protein HYPSUDRAFT_40010 [Hypholoma sublateritium FD-334 SS-4]